MVTLDEHRNGFVQRVIDALFSGDPEGVFTTGDLCREVYAWERGELSGEIYTAWRGYPGKVTKAQRVAVIRAAKAVVKEHPGMHAWKSCKRGGTWVFFHRDNVMSYAIAPVRSERQPYGNDPGNKEAREKLEGDEHSWEAMAPGGKWWIGPRMDRPA
jgi:hypothetical protein